MSIKVCIVDNTCVDVGNMLGFTFGDKELSRLDKIQNKGRKSESLAALEALRNITEDISDRHIERDALGRPHFKNAKEIDFSIAHSGSLSVAARVDSNFGIGVDIELIKEKDNTRIADRFFTEKEKSFLDRMKNNDGFYMLWTAKEAKAKRVGVGLSALLADKSDLSEGNDRFLQFSVEYKQSVYMLTLCVEREEKVEFLCDDSICVECLKGALL